MMDGLEDLPERVHAVEQKLDALGASVDQSFAEQRQYTEFAFGKLRAQMDQRFDAVDERFDAVDKRFDAVDVRFDRLERKIGWIIDRLR